MCLTLMRNLKEFKKTKIKMGVVANIFNPSTREPADRSVRVGGQSDLQRKFIPARATKTK